MTELQWKVFCTFKQNFLAKIDEWKYEQAVKRTKQLRPDLLK